MQAHSFFIGGVPMLFYGDESGYINDYSYLNDEGKSYDNRWMHRPVIDWERNKNIDKAGTIEHRIFTATQKLIALRKKLQEVADLKNLTWMAPHNIHIAGYVRMLGNRRLYCVFNMSDRIQHLTWYAFREHGDNPTQLYDHWQEKVFQVGEDYEYLVMEPYTFHLLEADVGMP